MHCSLVLLCTFYFKDYNSSRLNDKENDQFKFLNFIWKTFLKISFNWWCRLINLKRVMLCCVKKIWIDDCVITFYTLFNSCSAVFIKNLTIINKQTFSLAYRTGAVARPSLRSATAGSPSNRVLLSKSSTSSTIWNANPRFSPYCDAWCIVTSSHPLSIAT